jgi:hypothetical protein
MKEPVFVAGDDHPLDVAISLKQFVAGEIEEVFDFVAGEGVLPKILTGYGILPAVVSTSEVSGPWDRPGSHRIVHFADGSTAREALTAHDRPGHFAYRVSDPSFALKYLMTDARGEWWLKRTRGGTSITWTYSFRAKNRFAKLALALFVRSQWRGYMDVCLAHVVKEFGGGEDSR